MMVPGGRGGRQRAKAEAFDLDQRELQMALNVLWMDARLRMRFVLFVFFATAFARMPWSFLRRLLHCDAVHRFSGGYEDSEVPLQDGGSP